MLVQVQAQRKILNPSLFSAATLTKVNILLVKLYNRFCRDSEAMFGSKLMQI